VLSARPIRTLIAAAAATVSASAAGVVLACLPPATALAAATANPFGHLDLVAQAPGGFTAVGWAIDPDTTSPIQVHVYEDGVLVGATAADGLRADVGSTYLASGPNHGFEATFPVGAGPHRVCVYGINVGAGSSNTQLGCATVDVATFVPFGTLDGVTPAGDVWGWVLNPESAAPLQVDIYVDGRLTTRAAAADPRLDVEALYPAFGPFHGYRAKLTMPAGTHTVCTYAYEGDGGPNQTLGCRTLSVPAANPVGHLDLATDYTPSSAYPVAMVGGWAYDLNADGAPLAIQVTLDGQLALSTQTGWQRDDVAQVFPSYGDRTGFLVLVPASPGQHTVCATAINVGAGTGNTLLGCLAATVTSTTWPG